MPKYVNIKSYSIKIRKTNCFFFLMCLLVSFAGIMPVRSQEKTKRVTLRTEMLMKPKLLSHRS